MNLTPETTHYDTTRQVYKLQFCQCPCSTCNNRAGQMLLHLLSLAVAISLYSVSLINGLGESSLALLYDTIFILVYSPHALRHY